MTFFSKYGQIRRKLRIWSDLLKKSLMENFTFCAVLIVFMVSAYFLFICKFQQKTEKSWRNYLNPGKYTDCTKYFFYQQLQ